MAEVKKWVHPCLRCGACCSFYRVSFYWMEAENHKDAEYSVPQGTWEDLNSNYRAMKGTNQKDPKCESLHGAVGDSVFCSIYQNRPSPCRNFEASFETGKRNSRCDEARLRFGLKRLRKKDWIQIPTEPPHDQNPEGPKVA